MIKVCCQLADWSRNDRQEDPCPTSAKASAASAEAALRVGQKGQHQFGYSGTAFKAEEVTPTHADLLFQAEISCRYHRRMAAFLAWADTTMNWGTMIASAGAFVSIVGGEDSLIAVYATLVATLFSVTQITCQIGKRTTNHEGWHKRWRGLQAEIQNNPSPRPAKLKKWLTEISSIEQEFPHENAALRWDCRNEAIRSLGLDDAELRKIGWLQRRFLYVFPFQANFERRLKP